MTVTYTYFCSKVAHLNKYPVTREADKTTNIYFKQKLSLIFKFNQKLLTYLLHRDFKT